MVPGQSPETSAQTTTTEPTAAYSAKYLIKIESELKELLDKRENLEKDLNNIENSLYNLETSYIEDSVYGNIIKGYESFLTARTQHIRRQRPLESERIFSSSSVSYQRSNQSNEHVHHNRQSDISTHYHAQQQQHQSVYVEDDDDFILEKSSSNRKRKSLDGRRKKRVILSDED